MFRPRDSFQLSENEDTKLKSEPSFGEKTQSDNHHPVTLVTVKRGCQLESDHYEEEAAEKA